MRKAQVHLLSLLEWFCFERRELRWSRACFRRYKLCETVFLMSPDPQMCIRLKRTLWLTCFMFLQVSIVSIVLLFWYAAHFLHRIDPLTCFFAELTARLGFNLISIMFLILNVFSKNSVASLSNFLPGAFCQWPCQTTVCGSGAFDRRIDCMYLYFTEKSCSLLPEGSVAYQRPSRLLERECVALSYVSVDKKNVVSGFKWKHSVNKVSRPGLFV